MEILLLNLFLKNGRNCMKLNKFAISIQIKFKNKKISYFTLN